VSNEGQYTSINVPNAEFTAADNFYVVIAIGIV